MARDVSTSKELNELHDKLIDAGVRLLHEHGAAELTLRRVADAAECSTMGIYTGFGGRLGFLEALYLHGFNGLREAITQSTTGEKSGEPLAAIRRIALTYRRFALNGPGMYALMFERPMPDFDPSPRLRQEALGMTFELLAEAVTAAMNSGLLRTGDPARTSYLIWTTIHGAVSIELTHALRSPLPGWFLDTPEEGERVLGEAIDALLTGLSAPSPSAGTDPALAVFVGDPMLRTWVP